MSRFVPRRPLGRTGFLATALGIGDLADAALPLETLVATLVRALDRGLNLVDTAPSYEQGLSERVVGAALRGRREGVFLIDKVDHLDQPVAPQVAGSLERLGLPAADAFVFHAVNDLAVWDGLAAPGGGLEQLGREVAAGRARFRGISSHDPAVLLRAIPTGLLDLVMFPLGPWVDPRYEREVLPLARAAGVGTVCFKTFGAGKLLGDTEGYQRPLAAGRGLPRMSVVECLEYTLTLDPDVALLGLSTPAEQDEAFAATEAARRLSPEELAARRERARLAIANKGPVWWNPGER